MSEPSIRCPMDPGSSGATNSTIQARETRSLAFDCGENRARDKIELT